MTKDLPALVPPEADEHNGNKNSRANSERNQRLFDWALSLLQRLGLDKAVAQANSIEELGSISLDVDNVEVTLAIRDALYPASGEREEHFRGLREGGLKRILKNRFLDLTKDREAALRSRRSGRKQRDWTDDLSQNKKGEIVPNLANLMLILREAPKWEHVLAYDMFNAQVVIRMRPPWGEVARDTPWTDHHESLTLVWFQRENINPAIGNVGRAVQAAARYNAFHPVREYFDGLIWDGKPRLNSWLATYFRAKDNPYTRAIGPRYLISAVARIYQPGCKVDHTLVLEGPQGKQKSEALRRLAIKDEWFTDRLSHVTSKDAMQEMAGVLIIEVAEMDALTRAASSATKSFLTRRYDRFRPPYGKHLVRWLRQCVFAGTINPPIGGYLKDPTGARRFWPVRCEGTIDCEALERDRDQLWAEAVHRFKIGDPWWLETSELEALATTEQTARHVIDVWEVRVLEWLNNRNDVSIREVLEQALGLPQGAWIQSVQNRVAKILTHLGFSHHRPRVKGEREYRYHREPILGKSVSAKPDQPDQSDRPSNEGENNG